MYHRTKGDRLFHLERGRASSAGLSGDVLSGRYCSLLKIPPECKSGVLVELSLFGSCESSAWGVQRSF